MDIIEIIINWLLTIIKSIKISSFFIYIYKFYRKYRLAWCITPKIKEMMILDLSTKNSYYFKKSKELLHKAKCIIKEYEKTDLRINRGLNDLNNLPVIITYELSVYIPANEFIEYKNNNDIHKKELTVRDKLESTMNDSFNSFKSIIYEGIRETKTKVVIIPK